MNNEVGTHKCITHETSCPPVPEAASAALSGQKNCTRSHLTSCYLRFDKPTDGGSKFLQNQEDIEILSALTSPCCDNDIEK